MDKLTLQSNKREVLGKKTRFLRRQGITPTHLFGHSIESLSLQCDTDKLQQIIAHAGTTRLITVKVEGEKHSRIVFIREIQKNAITGQLVHVDLYQVRKSEKIKAEIPIVLVGEAPAMHLKGRMLIHSLTSLSVECLPDKLPPHIEVDLAPLEEIEQSIHIRDITLSSDITLFTDPDQMVVKVTEARVERAEEVVEEEVVEEEAVAEAEGGAKGKPEQ